MTAMFSEVPATIPASVLRRHAYATAHKTAVVLGLPQGGTSMLAAVVDALGVPMTAGKLFNFEAEDGRPHVGNDLPEWIGRVKTWNARADVWGFKDTIIFRHWTQDVHAALRNPYYLVAARDPVAIMQRRASNHAVCQTHHLYAVLEFILEQQQALWHWVQTLPDAPLIVVSYERALRAPELTCRLVAEFLGLQPTEEQIARATKRISPTGGYLLKEGDDGT